MWGKFELSWKSLIDGVTCLLILSSPIASANPEALAAHSLVETNGVRLHVAEAGGGEPIIFLHGFPENWFAWRYQIRALSEHFRVLAVDLKGYGLSDAPAAGYDANTVADDLRGLLDALGIQRANFVGHDWGALLLWRFVFAYPERCRRVCSLNTPHLLSYPDSPVGPFWRNLPRFSYMRFFERPRLPEFLLSWKPESALRAIYRATAYRGRLPLTRGELIYLANLYSRPGAFRGPLAYYRAMRQSIRQSQGDRSRKLEVPALLLLGKEDPLLRPALAEPMREMFTDMTFHHIPRCGHWTQLEQPDEVNRALERFFAH